MKLATKVLATLEAQRFTCAQAAREQSAQVAWANALERSAELFIAGYWQQARRVLEIARGAK